MAKEEKDPSKWDLDWKSIQDPLASESSLSSEQKRRRRLRPIPERYFFPRRSFTHNVLFAGASIGLGIGFGMLVEDWMKRKIERDGGWISWGSDE